MASTKKMTMEERLAMYRKRKRREEDIAAMKQKIWNFFTSFTLWGGPGDTSTASVQSPGEGEKVDEETKRLPNTSGNTVSLLLTLYVHVLNKVSRSAR